MRAITLIHNPSAGIQPIAAHTVLSLVRRAGYQPRYVAARRTANLTAALVRRSGLVAVAGGDGTVADVLRAGRNALLEVAIIPSGVANNIARSLGIDDALPGIVADWRASRASAVHLVAVDVAGRQRLVVESIGIGAFAGAAQTMPHRKTSSFGRTGMLHETRRHFRDVLRRAPTLERLTLDGERVKGKPILAEILNIPLTGPNLCLAGGAGLADGHLYVVHATEDHRQALIDWLEDGAHPAKRPALPTVRAKRFTIDWAGGPLRIDDRITQRTEGRLTAEVQRARIRLLAPL